MRRTGGKDVVGDFGPWTLEQCDGVFFLEYTGWPGVRCLFTTRVGGVSPAPYDSLNLDSNVGDDPELTEQNLRLMRSACRLGEQMIVRTRQVHSSLIGLVDSRGSDCVGDGLITAMRGVWLAVSLADCVAVYMYDVDTPAVGIVHAGWRGTLKRAAGSCVEQMSKGFGTNPARIRTLLGPGIGSCCFEVSQELALRFEEVFQGSSCEGHVDLFKANRMMLQELGIECQPKDPLCTSCNPHYFFSHRRDSGVTGRMLAMISLETGS